MTLFLEPSYIKLPMLLGSYFPDVTRPPFPMSVPTMCNVTKCISYQVEFYTCNLPSVHRIDIPGTVPETVFESVGK